MAQTEDGEDSCYWLYESQPMTYWYGWYSLHDAVQRMLNGVGEWKYLEFMTIARAFNIARTIITNHAAWDAQGTWYVLGLPDVEVQFPCFLLALEDQQNYRMFTCSPYRLPWMCEGRYTTAKEWSYWVQSLGFSDDPVAELIASLGLEDAYELAKADATDGAEQ